MRAAGALMVVLSCSVFGFSLAHSLKERSEFLRSLVRALTLLRNEVCASLLPVGDVIGMLAEDKNSEARVFFAECLRLLDSEGFKAAWVIAALGGREWGLESEECQQLAGLGDIIGRYEAEKQRELIDRVIAYFEGRAKMADEDRQRQYKLRTALGVGSGLMLAILML